MTYGFQFQDGATGGRGELSWLWDRRNTEGCSLPALDALALGDAVLLTVSNGDPKGSLQAPAPSLYSYAWLGSPTGPTGTSGDPTGAALVTGGVMSQVGTPTPGDNATFTATQYQGVGPGFSLTADLYLTWGDLFGAFTPGATIQLAASNAGADAPFTLFSATAGGTTGSMTTAFGTFPISLVAPGNPQPGSVTHASIAFSAMDTYYNGGAIWGTVVCDGILYENVPILASGGYFATPSELRLVADTVIIGASQLYGCDLTWIVRVTPIPNPDSD
jgi:hypothetical protein